MDSYGGPQAPVYDSYGGPLNRVDNNNNRVDNNNNNRVDPRTPNSPSTSYSAGNAVQA